MTARIASVDQSDVISVVRVFIEGLPGDRRASVVLSGHGLRWSVVARSTYAGGPISCVESQRFEDRDAAARRAAWLVANLLGGDDVAAHGSGSTLAALALVLAAMLPVERVLATGSLDEALAYAAAAVEADEVPTWRPGAA